MSSIKNWQGAYAELAAYDFLNEDIFQKRGYLFTPIQPNVDVDIESTFALSFKKKATNLDGFVEDYNWYFDVKVFKDNIDEILDGIYKKLLKHYNRKDIMISAEYATDISYNDFEKHHSKLYLELLNGINLNKKKQSVRSSHIPNLSFQILIGRGVLTSQRTYDPYAHAESFHKGIFNYVNKFVKDRPTIIVLVVFPWYNLNIGGFPGDDVSLFRSIARRVFCQYKHDDTKLQKFDSSFQGGQTIYEVSQYLSGIMFLRDDTILSKNPANINVDSFLYLNPNAINRLHNHYYSFISYSKGLKAFDDFEHDNY